MYPTTILDRAKFYLPSEHEAIFEQIDTSCSHYLASQVTLYKQLPVGTNAAQRIKLRHRRGDEFSQSFNECFSVSRLYERSLTCYTTTARELEEGYEWFAIFPPNGFKYYYNPACENISALRDIDPTLLKQVVDMSFLSERLQSHTYLDPEVIIFNIPSYYVIRQDV